MAEWFEAVGGQGEEPGNSTDTCGGACNVMPSAAAALPYFGGLGSFAAAQPRHSYSAAEHVPVQVTLPSATIAKHCLLPMLCVLRVLLLLCVCVSLLLHCQVLVTPIGRLKVSGLGVSEALAGEVVPAAGEDLLQLQRDDVAVSQDSKACTLCGMCCCCLAAAGGAARILSVAATVANRYMAYVA